MRKHTVVYILGLLLFGLNGIVASRITLSSYSIVFFRTMIGSAFLIVVFLAAGGRFRFFAINKTHLLLVVGSGIAMGISWMFLYEAYQTIGVGLASLVYYTGPVIVVLVSPLLFHEKLTIHKILCFAVVLTGMVLTNLRRLQSGSDRLGLLCGLGSAVMYAFMVILNKKAVSVTGMKNAVIQLTVSFLTVAVYVLFRQGVTLPADPAEWWWLILLGLLNTGVGCCLYFSSIGYLPVQTVSLLGYIEPLSALVFSVLLLGERFGVLQAAGAALILGGAVMLNLRGKGAPEPSAAPREDG